METHRRPPRDITPAEFFTSWLPEEIKRLGSATAIPDMVVRIELTGEGGGCWDLHPSGGELDVRSSAPDDPAPLVYLRMRSLSLQS